MTLKTDQKSAPQYAHIAIDVPLRTLFTYRIPKDFKDTIQRGKRVIVPFGRKEVIGICLKIDGNLSGIKETDLKEVLSVLDDSPLIDEDYIAWLEFASDYYCTPMGQVFSQAIPPYYFDIKKTESKKKIRFKEISHDLHLHSRLVTLTEEQEKVYDEIIKHSHEYFPALIHGITGSGKTEIYIRLIRKVLEQNQSALFLVPEIGLTPQMMARLNEHFKGSLLVYHSGLTKNQRLNQWQSCLETTPKVLVGTRSALFAPFNNLGLIVVDEEHDHSYKQEDRFRYHARDLAISRARQRNIPVVLGSATPSLESFFQTKRGKYHLFELKKRIAGAALPEIRVVNFGREKEQTETPLLVSQSIHDAIGHFTKKGKQMMLFVGQRGFSQNAYCVSCQQIQICPNCSVGLKFHKQQGNLKCHYCDYSIPFNGECLSCQKKALTLLGFGTQSVEEEISSMHPKLVVTRLDSDSVTNLSKLRQVFNDFAQGKINLIIGTQMISKGHDFENIGFVGVLGIDAHLGLPDFRAGEKAFQNLVQVAGRAGRVDKKGHVIVQSLMPDHASIQMGIKQDFQKFADHELEIRKALHYPPYSRLVQFRFLSTVENRLKDFMGTWSVFLDQVRSQMSVDDIQILGPTEMPIAKVRGKHRHHVVLKIKRGLKISDIVNYLVNDLNQRKLTGIQYQVDVDAVGLV